MDFIFESFSYFQSIIAVVVVLGGLIFFHELGHFLANRYFGIGVITFCIGMGPKLYSFTRGKTEYRLAWLPIGGYVSAVGEYSDEVEALGFTKEEAIYNRPAYQRLILAFAGPFANLLIAWLIYVGLSFSTGLAIPLPQLGEVLPDSPAQVAGLETGDIITKIGDKSIDSWEQVPQTITASNGNELTFEVKRNEETFLVNITPERMQRTNIFGEEETAWLVGIQALGTLRHEELSFFDAMVTGTKQTWNMISMTLTGLKKLITGSVAADNVGGPIMIVEMIGSQANVGIVPLLLLTALISVNLGLLNLLPIPVLDGGMILFCLIEIIIRRPVPEKVQEWSMKAGVIFLISLMVFATFNDVMRWFQ